MIREFSIRAIMAGRFFFFFSPWYPVVLMAKRNSLEKNLMMYTPFFFNFNSNSSKSKKIEKQIQLLMRNVCECCFRRERESYSRYIESFTTSSTREITNKRRIDEAPKSRPTMRPRDLGFWFINRLIFIDFPRFWLPSSTIWEYFTG